MKASEPQRADITNAKLCNGYTFSTLVLAVSVMGAIPKILDKNLIKDFPPQ